MRTTRPRKFFMAHQLSVTLVRWRNGSLQDEMVRGTPPTRQCAAFRSEQRFPAMTWSNGLDGGSIWRASQPKVGLQGNRNVNDELFLKHIMEAAASANAVRAEHLPVILPYVLKQLTGTADPKIFSVDGCFLKIMDLSCCQGWGHGGVH